MQLSENFIMKLPRIFLKTLAKTEKMLAWSKWFSSDAPLYSFKVQYWSQSSGSGFRIYSQQYLHLFTNSHVHGSVCCGELAAVPNPHLSWNLVVL